MIIVIPKHSFQSMSPADNPFLALDKEKIYLIMGYAQEEEDTKLLPIDDYASEMKNGDVLKLLNSLINNRRHLRLSIWMGVQTYKSIPLIRAYL